MTNHNNTEFADRKGDVPVNFPFQRVLKQKSHKKTFSICCIVTDWQLYGKIRGSLELQGFNTENSEFLIADNIEENEFSAYEAIQCFVKQAVGKYIIILHQDAFPLESSNKLLERISELERHDPDWGIIGNAGKPDDRSIHGFFSIETYTQVYRIQHPFIKVQVIDENVIIIKNGLGITVSGDIGGYHFYGFDISSVATRLGYSVYVIDFLWAHHSDGTIDESFINSHSKVEEKMKNYHRFSRAATTCTLLYWGESDFQAMLTKMKALYMIDIVEVHQRAYALMLSNSRKKWWYFPFLYRIFYSGIIAKKVRIACIYIRYRFRCIYKPLSWHVIWWKDNWRSRIPWK